jgi:copper transport protein
MTHGWGTRLILIGSIAIALSIGPGAIGDRAGAHAQLKSSDPANGANLGSAPSRITLHFTEPPEPSLSTVRVLDSAGREYQGDSEVSPDDEFTLTADVSGIDDGVYTVTWRAVSKADGHTTAGTFAFGVGEDPKGAVPPPSVDTEGPGTSPIEIGGRWLFLLGLVLLTGCCLIGALVVREIAPGLRRCLWISLGLSVVGAVGLMVGQLVNASASIGGFLSTDIGLAVVWRLVAVAFAAAGIVLAIARPKAVRDALLIAFAAGAAAMFVHVDAGHAGAQPEGRIFEIVFQWTHFLTAGIWIGGLTGLLASLSILQGDRRAKAARRFSTIAGLCLAPLLAAGVLRALDELDGWSDLFGSTYGLLVVAKSAVFLALVGLGALNRYKNVPRAGNDPKPLRKVSRVEVSLGALVLLLAAVMASVSPPSTEEAVAREPARITVKGEDFATSVKAELTVDPGLAGINDFVLDVRDYDSGEPFDASRVALRFSFPDNPAVGSSQLVLRETEPGTYEANGPNLSLAGRWEITATIEHEATSVDVPFALATRCEATELAEPGQPSIWVMDTGDGSSIHGFIDPGTAGTNDVHVTFYDSKDREVKIDRAPAITATSGDQKADLEVSRLSKGHFSGAGRLTAGKWRFSISGRTPQGSVAACFEETVED